MDGEYVGSVDSDLNSLLESYSILRRVDKCDLTGQSGVIFFFFQQWEFNKPLDWNFDFVPNMLCASVRMSYPFCAFISLHLI